MPIREPSLTVLYELIFFIFTITLCGKYCYHPQDHTADKWQSWGSLAPDSTLKQGIMNVIKELINTMFVHTDTTTNRYHY